MATVRMAFGSVMDTLTQTAATATNVVKTVSDGVSMVNRFVDSAATDQRDRQLVHRKMFRDNLLRESRLTVAQSNEAVLEYVGKNEICKELYAQAEQLLPNNLFD